MNRILNRKFDSKSNRISKLRRSLIITFISVQPEGRNFSSSGRTAHIITVSYYGIALNVSTVSEGLSIIVLGTKQLHLAGA